MAEYAETITKGMNGYINREELKDRPIKESELANGDLKVFTEAWGGRNDHTCVSRLRHDPRRNERGVKISIYSG